MLKETAQHVLIEIVREALRKAVEGQSSAPPVPQEEELHQKCGCFVTYKTDGELRGCLGCFVSEEPLYLTVSKYAQLSATEDPRFVGNRIQKEELDAVTLDISVLSPLEPCEDPFMIELGKHGIYVKSGWRSGCFLPQVATETGWSVEQFWSACCSHKAGLAPNAWKTDDVERYIFTAQVIEDPAPKDL